MAEDLELPDEVFGFGSWLLWMIATRATALVDRVYEAGPARPSRKYGMVDGHHVPTPSLIAWLLTAAEFGVPAAGLAQRGAALDQRQKVLRTTVNRAIGGEPRLFKDGWLRDLAITCGLGERELEFLLSSRDDTHYAVDQAALRAAIARTFRFRPAPGTQVRGAAVAMRTLPRDTASFTGRAPQLHQLSAAADAAVGSGAVVQIHAIGGMAGVGKTAFAIHAAHQLAPRFPDGQIFLPLHAHTPGQEPVDPTDALASLLQISGVAAGRIPPGLESRMALWRDHLADKRLLLLLDDAAGHEQVRPLLPGSTGSLVLITSRRHLTALEDAQPISLDTLAPGDAGALLARLAGRPGLDPGDPVVGQITRLCGYLPLAVGMVARQLHHHPSWAAADLAAELAAARDRLELMRAENLSVAAAFDLSYADLTAAQQQLFRRLGLHPGTDIDAYAAAALDNAGLAAARRHLDALYDHYLITEPARGRYRLHDLIRQHARGKAAGDPGPDRDAATSRLLDYYLHGAAVAEFRLARQSRTRPEADVRIPPPAIPDLSEDAQAMAWARAERGSLLACLDHATGTGQHARVASLTAAIAPLLRQDGPWTEAIVRHATAVQAARQVGSRLLEANALSDLGDIRHLDGDYPGATVAQQEALVIYRDLGDRLGQANALLYLGVVRKHTGDDPGAARALAEALGIYRDLGQRQGQANALTYLGAVQQATGDYRPAAEALAEALRIYRGLGDLGGEVQALNELGTLYRAGGDPRARECHQQALDLARKIDSPWDEAHALVGLGRCTRAPGHIAQARTYLQQARQIFERIGAAEAGEVAAELDADQAELRPADGPHQPASSSRLITEV
jgi:tetratricopeptide (TPR) repeat protein